MTAYYNEIDPGAAAWLRELIKAEAIAPGHVDERDINDVRPSDLEGFTQCHFFAGIGVWSYALRLAGWSDSEPVWTGSCPCQPFSTAGKGAGFADERHLWPAWFHLIQERGPHVIFGEQVASKDGLAWLDLVQTDLEATDHAFAPLDLCAAGFGAPHIRQRLFWVAESNSQRQQGIGLRIQSGQTSELADPDSAGSQGRFQRRNSTDQRTPWTGGMVEWIHCRDGKRRPIERGTFPLAHGTAARVGLLRGYGNAIVAPQAAEFIKAYMQC